MPSARWRSSAASRTASGTSRPRGGQRHPPGRLQACDGRALRRPACPACALARPRPRTQVREAGATSARRAARSRSRLRFSSAALSYWEEAEASASRSRREGTWRLQVGDACLRALGPLGGGRELAPELFGLLLLVPQLPAQGLRGFSLLPVPCGAASGSGLPHRLPADWPGLPAGVRCRQGQLAVQIRRRRAGHHRIWVCGRRLRAPRPDHRRLRSPRRAARLTSCGRHGHRSRARSGRRRARDDGEAEPVTDFLAQSLVLHQGVDQAAAVNAEEKRVRPVRLQPPGTGSSRVTAPAAAGVPAAHPRSRPAAGSADPACCAPMTACMPFLPTADTYSTLQTGLRMTRSVDRCQPGRQ